MDNPPTLPIKTRRIFVVVEDPETCQHIALRLEIEGYTVLKATSGQEALKGMEWVTPDLIISGVRMSMMNVVDFYQMVRKNPRWVPIPFIFLGSDIDLEEVHALAELESEEYIGEPINVDVLARVVNARLLRSAEIKVAHLDQAYLETVTMLAKAIENRDPYTHGHVERVVRYSRWLAEALGWPPDLLRTLEFGARLHDIGKIIVSDEILKKNGPLTPQEWDVMKRHPLAGSKMLEEISHLHDTIPYVLYHHEWWDGSGYPTGLKGRDIPIEGRVMAIIDVFDALSTPRPYHPAVPYEDVRDYLKSSAGTQFDPELAESFLRILSRKRQS